MAKMKGIDWVALSLVLAGAINWGLVGFFSFNLVGWLASISWAWLEMVIYDLVGIAGLYSIYALAKK